MKVMYFAWLRQRLGISEEIVSPPASVNDVESLLDWLSERSPEFTAILQDRKVIRVAVNQEYVEANRALAKDDEIALFPPVTGG